MKDESIYRKVQEALERIPESFSILEEQIDIQLQMEYFEFSNAFRNRENIGTFIDRKDELFDNSIDIETKKKILVALASSDEVENFRFIEKYGKNPDNALREWSILALQESRMMLQSSLLNEQQVFISTGLGGKGHKLRYFVVFLHRNGNALSDMQRNLLFDELQYVIEKNEGELEETESMIDFSTALLVLPVRAPLKEIFSGIIDECNQYGDFLAEDILVTNVKKLTPYEILEMMNAQKNREIEAPDELNFLNDEDE